MTIGRVCSAFTFAAGQSNAVVTSYCTTVTSNANKHDVCVMFTYILRNSVYRRQTLVNVNPYTVVIARVVPSPAPVIVVRHALHKQDARSVVRVRCVSTQHPLRTRRHRHRVLSSRAPNNQRLFALNPTAATGNGLFPLVSPPPLPTTVGTSLLPASHLVIMPPISIDTRIRDKWFRKQTLLFDSIEII